MPDEAPVTIAVVFSLGVGSAMAQSVGDRVVVTLGVEGPSDHGDVKFA